MEYIRQHLGWNKISFMGHSLGRQNINFSYLKYINKKCNILHYSSINDMNYPTSHLTFLVFVQSGTGISGVVITYLYGAFYPNIVDFSICLDAAKPLIYKNNNDRIAKLIQNFMKYNTKYELQSDDPPSYTLEEIMMKLSAGKSVFYEHTHHLIE